MVALTLLMSSRFPYCTSTTSAFTRQRERERGGDREGERERERWVSAINTTVPKATKVLVWNQNNKCNQIASRNADAWSKKHLQSEPAVCGGGRYWNGWRAGGCEQTSANQSISGRGRSHRSWKRIQRNMLFLSGLLLLYVSFLPFSLQLSSSNPPSSVSPPPLSLSCRITCTQFIFHVAWGRVEARSGRGEYISFASGRPREWGEIYRPCQHLHHKSRLLNSTEQTSVSHT